MPIDLSIFPNLDRILRETYKHELVYKKHQDGAYDNNWIKEFELFYNKQAKSAPYVKRIFLKVNERRGKNAGFVDIRPITDGSEVCETYLIPPKALSVKNHVYIKCLRDYNQYGATVRCAPYIMPESIFGMCIHASVWICLKMLEGMTEKPLTIPEIQSRARGTPFADSQGLLFAQTARILRMSRAYAFYINNYGEEYLDDDRMLMELYAYVESNLPVIIGVHTNDLSWWTGARTHGYHSIVAIGHTMRNNKIDGFVFHDESVRPYTVLKKNQLLKAWHVPKEDVKPEFQELNIRELLVAVPPEVTLPFHRAFQQFEQWLEVLIKRELIEIGDTKNLEFRPILIPTIVLLYEPSTNSLMSALQELNQVPKYVWALFLFDKVADRTNFANAKGFFIRDATRETEFRFLYMKDQKFAIYQLTPEKIYARLDKWKGRKKL